MEQAVRKLNINIGGSVVARRAPCAPDTALLRDQFGLDLPDELHQLLCLSNGGHPERDTFIPSGASPDEA